MMTKRCTNLRIRKKKNIPYFFCVEKKCVIDNFGDCDSCGCYSIKSIKPIKLISPNKERVSVDTYNYVINRDKHKCQLCGKNDKQTKLDLHHIRGRTKLLTNDVKNCIMLCHDCHINIVHRNMKYYIPLLMDTVEENEKGINNGV